MLPNKARGVPRVDDRRVLNGIFWVLRSGAPWRDPPIAFGPYTTCYNRFVRWRRAGVWSRIIDALAAAHDAAVQMIDTSIVRVHQHGACLARNRNRTHAELIVQDTGISDCTAELASNFRSIIERAGLKFVVSCAALPERVYIDHDMGEKVVLTLGTSQMPRCFWRPTKLISSPILHCRSMGARSSTSTETLGPSPIHGSRGSLFLRRPARVTETPHLPTKVGKTPL
jgi:transposase